jgi:hypothetical protein
VATPVQRTARQIGVKKSLSFSHKRCTSPGVVQAVGAKRRDDASVTSAHEACASFAAIPARGRGDGVRGVDLAIREYGIQHAGPFQPKNYSVLSHRGPPSPGWHLELQRGGSAWSERRNSGTGSPEFSM